MIYLHDVWVNWFEGEENSYNICYYHEWRKSDPIKLIDQMPLLYIGSQLYHYIANDLHELPEKLLDRIYQKSFRRERHIRKPIDFAAVITDGKDMMAFDTIGYELPIRKSRLIPRQEQIVFQTTKRMKRQSFSLPVEHYKKQYHLLSLRPSLVLGLTRRERNLKRILMMGLDQLRAMGHPEALRYWLTEWDPKRYERHKSKTKEELWKALYDGTKYSWSRKHVKFGEKLIRGYPFLQQLWDVELQKSEEKPSFK